MDPSLSISSDPHHNPPPFAAFPPFAASNPFAAASTTAPTHTFFGGHVAAPTTVAASNNNHVLQPSPNHAAPPPPQPPSAPIPPHPSFNHPPYSDMICSAIAALNEPDGSSKQAISRYIERVYSGLPPAHGALLTHHLKTLKNSGVLVMVKKSYKFASAPPPASVAVAAAAAAAGLEAPRSDLLSNTVNDHPQPDPAGAAASATQKRGRGRPPKPKFGAQSSQVQPNGQPSSDQNDLFVSGPVEEAQQTRRQPGRPRKSAAAATLQAAPATAAMKRRGRPPGRRGRKPKSVSAPASVFPYAANGVKRRGRPKRVDSAAAAAAAPVPAAVESRELGPTPGKRRGRPRKIGGVISKPMKPKRSVSRTGRPVGRPRKNVSWAMTEVPGQQAADYGELKRKYAVLQEKVKEAVNVLKAEVTSENQAAFLAIQELESLVVTETNEPQPMEEAQPQEAQPPMPEVQTEAEAMQEALF